VIKHQQKMQTAESNLKSAQDLLTPKEWKVLHSGLEVPPSRTVSPANRDEEDGARARDRSSSRPKVAFAAVRPTPSPSPSPAPPSEQADDSGPGHSFPFHGDRPVSRYSGQSPERSHHGTGPPRRSAAPAVTAPAKQENGMAREVGHTPEVRLAQECWNCNKPGHYASTCPDPKKPRGGTPTTSYDKSRTQYPGGSRTANVATPVKSGTEKRVEFSTGGADYWPALMAVRKADTTWIRCDRD
jgi:hypothetical protein